MLDLWNELAAGRSGWFWFAGFLRNGDIYHVCSLAAAFRHRHVGGSHLYLIVAEPSQAKVAQPFIDRFDEVIIDDRFSSNGSVWDDFFRETGLPRFGRDTPILTHPYYYPWGPRATDMCLQTGRSWMDVYKNIFALPGGTEPAAPSEDEGRKRRAAAFCSEIGMPKGRSVILFPYAQSLQVSARAHFERLALDLASEGYSVYTSISGDETALAHTRGVFIRFDLLADVAELCGWVVATRSGICDIVSAADCRKTFIYPNLPVILTWGVSAMDLARDAHELVFSFDDGAERFSEAVRSGQSVSQLAVPPRRVTSELGSPTGTAIATLSFFSSTSAEVAEACRALARSDIAAAVIRDVPSRNQRRWDGKVDDLIDALAVNTLAVHACRDDVPAAAIEEVTGYALAAGRYTAAPCWHSLIVVGCGYDLASLLPAYVRASSSFPASLYRPGSRIVLSDFHGRAEHAEASAHDTPLLIAGMQFLAGWSRLENWGLWSDGLAPTLKIFIAEPLQQGSFLHVEARGCVSPAHPRLNVSVLVNGSRAADWVIDAFSHNTTSIPLDRLPPREGAVTICFGIEKVLSPAEQAMSSDNRRLGIGITSLCILPPNEVQV